MGEEQIVQLLLLLLPSRMEIGSLEEKIGSQDQGSTRNNVVDFDFLFEFSPERRTESDLRFEQDQSQQGGSQSQTEGNRSRRFGVEESTVFIVDLRVLDSERLVPAVRFGHWEDH